MRICEKEGCENIVPKYYVDEKGKKHTCQRRKFCFECSPFGEHNTRNLNNKNTGICPECGNQSQNGRKLCYRCYFYKREKIMSKKVYDIIGYDCWKCGYDKGIKGQSILDFHHVLPDSKLFGLTTREFVGYAWDRVWLEMKKCVSICCRCHREYHAGIISNEEINKIYEERWKDILGT